MAPEAPHSSPRVIPVPSDQRLEALDVLRGFALLGILVMNIRTFGMIGAAYFFPDAYGDLSTPNLAVWWFGELLASRKFMTLFSLLFGAGVLLQAGRCEEGGRSFRGLHYRRMFWLWLFGLVHTYLFWDGDILVSYAVCGLFLYPARKLRPGWLVALGLLVLAVGSALSLLAGLSASYWDPAQLADFKADWQPGSEAIREEVAALTGTWWQEIRFRFPHALEMHLFVLPFHMIWRGLGVMLLGMALFKKGLIQAPSRPVVTLWLLLGGLVGLPVTAWGTWLQYRSGWEPISAFFLHSQFGYWASLLVALGWLGLVHRALGNNWLPGLQARLAATGRMALTNYLLQTLLCTTLFYGRGLGLFGQLPRIGLLGVVLAVWALQLWFSPWWLRRFRFGPAEWLWRSLSYWRRQPMRISSR